MLYILTRLPTRKNTRVYKHQEITQGFTPFEPDSKVLRQTKLWVILITCFLFFGTMTLLCLTH